MKISPSIDIIWRLAAAEVTAGDFDEIQPEHFCMAVLKFAEVPAKIPGELGEEAELAMAIAGEVKLVREALVECGIESKTARRKLRRLLGKGDAPFKGGNVHRSPASRTLFESAAVLAAESGGGTLTPLHLLTALVQSPTPAIIQAVLSGKTPAMTPPVDLPLLEEHGVDLAKQADEGKIRVNSGHVALCKAVLRSLQELHRKSVLLVCDSDDLVEEVSSALACTIAARDAPEGLRKRRLFDISVNSSAKSPKEGASPSLFDETALAQMRQMLAEAGDHPEVILLVPAVDTAQKASGDGWIRLLTETLEHGAVQFICRVTPAVFAERLRNDPAWKRKTHAIWLDHAAQGSVPREL